MACQPMTAQLLFTSNFPQTDFDLPLAAAADGVKVSVSGQDLTERFNLSVTGMGAVTRVSSTDAVPAQTLVEVVFRPYAYAGEPEAPAAQPEPTVGDTPSSTSGDAGSSAAPPAESTPDSSGTSGSSGASGTSGTSGESGSGAPAEPSSSAS